MSGLKCVPVIHCSDAWGFVIEHGGVTSSATTTPRPWSIVYSGDTRPCDALIAAGQNATVLIHEATFDDDRMADAVAKRHSTRCEALSVAERMGAYRTILTHLSQRYREIYSEGAEKTAEEAEEEDGEWMEENGSGGSEAEPAAGTSLVAFDLMAINLADLDGMPQHLNTLRHFRACERKFTRAAKEAEVEAQRQRTERIEREIEEAAAAAVAVQ